MKINYSKEEVQKMKSTIKKLNNVRRSIINSVGPDGSDLSLENLITIEEVQMHLEEIVEGSERE